jgi:hypothetical protein
MSKQVRFRRGTTAQHAVFTGAAGEVTVDTDKNCMVVHDGATAGGIPVARADRPRGFTRQEIFTANSNWTQTGKTDLKRIIVTAYGGGNSGGGNSGGGAGGIGIVTLEASSVSTNVTVTIGAAGGGTTSFGTYISATGGTAGSGQVPGVGGSASGTGVYILGGQAGYQGNGTSSHNSGGGFGGGKDNVVGKGIFGAGGGTNAAGTAGCIIVQEIYGYV